jgi:hypothetical protein
MHNIQVDAASGATSTDIIRLIYKQCNPMVLAVTVGSFPAPINAIDSGVHTVRKEGNNIYLDALDTRIQIRESGGFLIFGISTPFWNGPGICNGCAPGDDIDTTSFPQKRNANAFSIEQANTTCINAGLSGFFLDGCIFDLVTTGNDTYVAQASSAVQAYNEVQVPFNPPESPSAPTLTNAAAIISVPILLLVATFCVFFGLM